MQSKPLVTFGQKLRALGSRANQELAKQFEKMSAAATRDKAEAERQGKAKQPAKLKPEARAATLAHAHAQIATLSAGPAAVAPSHAPFHPKAALPRPGLKLAQVAVPLGVNVSGPKTQSFAWKAPKTK